MMKIAVFKLNFEASDIQIVTKQVAVSN